MIGFTFGADLKKKQGLTKPGVDQVKNDLPQFALQSFTNEEEKTCLVVSEHFDQRPGWIASLAMADGSVMMLKQFGTDQNPVYLRQRVSPREVQQIVMAKQIDGTLTYGGRPHYLRSVYELDDDNRLVRTAPESRIAEQAAAHSYAYAIDRHFDQRAVSLRRARPVKQALSSARSMPGLQKLLLANPAPAPSPEPKSEPEHDQTKPPSEQENLVDTKDLVEDWSDGLVNSFLHSSSHCV